MACVFMSRSNRNVNVNNENSIKFEVNALCWIAIYLARVYPYRSSAYFISMSMAFIGATHERTVDNIEYATGN